MSGTGGSLTEARQKYGIRADSERGDDDERDGNSSSDWFTDPPSPASLSSSLLALSPLSSFSISLPSDLDPTPNHEQVQHRPEATVSALVQDQTPCHAEVARPAPAPVLKSPRHTNTEPHLCCIRCGSSLIPLPPTTTTEQYLLSLPMRRATRSTNPPLAAAPEAPARRGSSRKRKASNPPAEELPSPPSQAEPASVAAPAKKKKRTTGAAAPSLDATVTPEVPAIPAPSQSLPASQPPPDLSTAIDPALLHLPTSTPGPVAATASESNVLPTSVEPSGETPADVQPTASTEAAPGDSTRNRAQRAPGLREENTALTKAKVELEEKVKQLTADIRTLKKYKVMWVKEYSKKAKVDSQPGDSLILRPPGEKGKNGWNLQDAMGLKEDDALYNEILRSARHCISRSGIDWEATYSEQEPGRLAACFKELKRQHPYLERFQGDWPAKEMVISALQNRRKALSAKAKAKASVDGRTQADFMAAGAAVDAGEVD
ncbi:hypothetical protein M407DRAFT_25241 [Tulasnella calospora MUT 4182]|uniref:Uncharacterized protein n=1 Tax=Tulasnella calospora MUT 4182 TaxID=1051891 RepID=A0A0C3KVG6_9AGAM|nr:hypothetical protein M407DRAFT_25241 [Tulasnella calospora MUT 4182]